MSAVQSISLEIPGISGDDKSVVVAGSGASTDTEFGFLGVRMSAHQPAGACRKSTI
ncbi:hypothetical protein ALP71_102597 [Pseudomonas coronafaciens pv. garcae]|nr:hypothetical protein ALP71_102597 [Pseudomonas coronafaciens pv. garcae]